MNPEKLADKARKAISKYCMEECRSYCCRKGYLTLTLKELNTVLSGVKDQSDIMLKHIKGDNFSIYMGRPNQPCPAFDGEKCSIHKKKNRPKVCKEFPIFIEGKNIYTSRRCPAVKEGKLYPYLREFIMHGYNIIYPEKVAEETPELDEKKNSKKDI